MQQLGGEHKAACAIRGISRVAEEGRVSLTLTRGPPQCDPGSPGSAVQEGFSVEVMWRGPLKAEQNSICRRRGPCSLRKEHSGVFGEEEWSRPAAGRVVGETGEAGEVGWGHGARAQNVIPRRLTLS